MPQAQGDAAIRGAHTIAPLHARFFGNQLEIGEVKVASQHFRVGTQPGHESHFFGMPWGDEPSLQTPQVPPKPMVTRPPSTMTGTRRCPELCLSILARPSESDFTSTYSIASPFSAKASRAAVV